MDYEVVGHLSPLRTWGFSFHLSFNFVASESHLLGTKGSLETFVLLLPLWKACQWSQLPYFLGEGKLGTSTFNECGFGVEDVG